MLRHKRESEHHKDKWAPQRIATRLSSYGDSERAACTVAWKALLGIKYFEIQTEKWVYRNY